MGLSDLLISCLCVVKGWRVRGVPRRERARARKRKRTRTPSLARSLKRMASTCFSGASRVVDLLSIQGEKSFRVRSRSRLRARSRGKLGAAIRAETRYSDVILRPHNKKPGSRYPGSRGFVSTKWKGVNTLCFRQRFDCRVQQRNARDGSSPMPSRHVLDQEGSPRRS